MSHFQQKPFDSKYVSDKMEILVDNFKDRLNFMVESILSADFIAVDTEFSGLSVGFEDKAHGFD